MAALERKYIVPLRKEWLKVPSYKRTKKAINALKQFLQKHMKVEDVKIGHYLNKKMWERGMKKPPHKIEVLATKVEEKDHTYVTAELPDAPKVEVKEAPKKPGTVAEKLKNALKEPEAAKKEEAEKEQKMLKKETEHKAEATKTPAPKKKETKPDNKETIIKHTGKSKEGVETTGQE